MILKICIPAICKVAYLQFLNPATFVCEIAVYCACPGGLRGAVRLRAENIPCLNIPVQETLFEQKHQPFCDPI